MKRSAVNGDAKKTTTPEPDKELQDMINRAIRNMEIAMRYAKVVEVETLSCQR